jgi:hypothetical protein
MVYKKLLETIRENIDPMANQWADEVQASEFFKTYQKFERDEIKRRAGILFAKLAQWLESGGDYKESEKYFIELGRERFREGFPLPEVHLAIYVTKKIFWKNIDWRDAITGSFRTDHATQIMSVLNDYFDLGNYYVTRGYFRELLEKMSDQQCFKRDELEFVLCKGLSEKEVWKKEDFGLE